MKRVFLFPIINQRTKYQPLSLPTRLCGLLFSTWGPFSEKRHPNFNIPPSVCNKVGKMLHKQANHPLNIIKLKIEEYFNSNPHALNGRPCFVLVDDLNPVSSIKNNFDDLRIGPDHPSRQPSDTYFIDDQHVLRTHTSAHQTTLLRQGLSEFLVSGDVFRRDQVDSTHYPVFHQMEGVRVWNIKQIDKGVDPLQFVVSDLKQGLEGLAKHLFGDCQTRWSDDYFPFTDPSFELEVHYKGNWMEVLGCGVIHPQVLKNAGRNVDDDEVGWAFGLGLERLAMVLFDIPDIRLFWTDDPRFHAQFKDGSIAKFQPYSKFPPCLKDVSFWLDDAVPMHRNDLFEVIRDIAGDLVEQVSLIDEFKHPKSGKISNCYRITYRSMDRSLTNQEIDDLQEEVRKQLATKFSLSLR